MKVWPETRRRKIHAIVLLLPFLLAKDPVNPTPSDWWRYQSLVESAQWN